MMEAYESIVFSASGQEGMKNFLNVLLDTPSGATLWHCTAGKDRTGVSGAILLYLLGASYEDIVDDYLLTNEMRADVNAAIMQQAVDSGFPKEKVSLIEPLLLEKKDYLDSLVEQVVKKYGSIDAFIVEALEMTEEKKQKLRTMYTE